jgi:hypothetical protein
MTNSARNLLPLWDFGWCDHDRPSLPRCHAPQDVIRQYVSSAAFGTSFVGQENEHAPELHGPFWSSAVSEPDFELITPQRLAEEVDAIRQPPGFTEPASDEQWQPVQSLLSEVCSRSTWIFMLRLTENDRDRFHDWGFVLLVFREFLCASPDSDSVDRLVFGYD